MLKILLLSAFVGVTLSADTCINCICQRESGCKPISCYMDTGSLACGYYQIRLPYYIDCGQPGKKDGETTETAWKRCVENYDCSTTCVLNYVNRYKAFCTGKGECETMSRIHHGGPNGCKTSVTIAYWNNIKSCCQCS